MKKLKKTYTEKYRAGSMWLKDHSLPALRHIDSAYITQDAEIMEAGHGTFDGDPVEYQIIRVVLKRGIID